MLLDRLRVRQLFTDALDLPEDRRPSFLAAACPSDSELRLEVEALLASHDRAGPFFAEPTVNSGPASDQPPPIPVSHIGPYRLLQRIGEGGFGEVWEAEQREPVRRRVALKIVKAGMDSSEILARFEAERQALALMDHPNVAKVFDAGATPTTAGVAGRPFVVMEHVPGLPITDYCDAARLPIRRRLELFIPVCHAVQHAHTKGIIHRDLKPSNILVTLIDGQPVPKVIDFGIAKATAGAGVPLTDRTLFTRIGRLMGTPEYMSPEQAGGGVIPPGNGSGGVSSSRVGGLDIDTRSDIYSLGVILYQLLTGTLPFDPRTLHDSDLAGLARIIRELEPDKPSTRLSTLSKDPVTQHSGATPQDISARRATDYPALQRQLRGELDWIVMKCLEKERARRYETANGLAMDVQRHLSGEPIIAAPPSRYYRLCKTVTRHRTAFAGGGAIVAALLIGLALALYAFRRADELRVQAEESARDAREEQADSAAAMTLLGAIFGPDDGGGFRDPDFTVRQLLDDFEKQHLAELTSRPRVEAEVRLHLGHGYQSIGEYRAAAAHMTRTLELYRAHYGKEHEHVANRLVDLACVLHDQGNHLGAQSAAREALAIYRKSSGDSTRAVATALNELGGAAGGLGNIDEEERLYREAADILQGLPPEEQTTLPAVLHNLGLSLFEQRRFSEAEPLIRESIDASRQLKPRSDLAAGLNTLGCLLQKEGDLGGAERSFREAVSLCRDPREASPVLLALVLHHLADVLREAKQTDEARELAAEALAIYRTKPDVDPNEFGHALEVLGAIHDADGDADAAEALLREALTIQRRLTGSSPHDLLALFDHLCRFLLETRADCAAAVSVGREGLAAARSLDTSTPSSGWSPALLHQLADALRICGELAEAEQLAKEAIDCYRRHPHDYSRKPGDAVQVLVKTLADAGRLDESDPVLLDAIDVLRRNHPEGRHTLAYSLHHLAQSLGRNGALRLAENLGREAIAIYRECSTEHSDEHRCAVDVLAQILRAAGEPSAAETIRRDFVEYCRRRLPDACFTLAGALGPLGLLLLDQGRFEDVEPILRETLAIRENLLKPGDPNFWLLAQNRSMLGEALAGQAAALVNEAPGTAASIREGAASPEPHAFALAKLREAEPLILDGYAWLSANFERITPALPLQLRQDRVRQAGERIVRLYEVWDNVEPGRGYVEKAAAWRRTLESEATPPEGPKPGPSP